jgi:hypothetical protein
VKERGRFWTNANLSLWDDRMPAPVRQSRRLWVLAGLAVVCLGLFIANRLFVVDPAPAPALFREDPLTAAALNAHVDSVCIRFGIDPDMGRTRRVQGVGGPPTQNERRFRVPPDFSTLEFNSALSTRLLPTGARVVATERTKEKSVSMCIVKNGQTLLTVVLDVRRDPQ